MTDWTPHEMQVSLDFLLSGEYTARLYPDDSMDQEQPNATHIETQSANHESSLPIAAGRGFTAIFAPQ